MSTTRSDRDAAAGRAARPSLPLPRTPGERSRTARAGVPALLGVRVDPFETGDGRGARVVATVAGSGAARAGLTPGDTITSVGGTTLTSSTELGAVVAFHRPGDVVDVRWESPIGEPHDARVRLTDVLAR